MGGNTWSFGHSLFLMDGPVMMGDFQMADQLRITTNLKCDQEKAPTANVWKILRECFQNIWENPLVLIQA